MKIEYLSKNYNMGERFKELVDEKLSKLNKYFDHQVSVKVFASSQNKIEKLEITIKGKNLVYRAEVAGENMFENIDLALPKIEKQIVRKNQKLREFDRKKAVDLPFEFIEKQPEKLGDIAKRKSFDLDPILVEDARFMLEDIGHSFYVFLNAETGKVNVIYKRNDKKYGLIEVNY